MSQTANGPLDGVRVIDCTHMLAGPYCTMLLADLGADVVKVEYPGGDMARRIGPLLEERPATFGGYFQSVNRGKRSIVLDLKSGEGVDAFRRLIATADVFVESFRAGVTTDLGIGWAELEQLNRRLVYASIRGFGDPELGSTPYATWPAFDLVAQAMGGLMGITGPVDGPPLKAGPGIGDIFPGVLAALGIVSALRVAEQSGKGQRVDIAMVDGVLALCERIVHQYSYSGESPGPSGNEHPLLCPYDVFEASDGWIVIAAPSDSHWQELTRIIGRPELGDDERLATNPGRVANRGEVIAAITAWASGKAKGEISLALGGRVPVAPVMTAEDIFAEPHFRDREMLVEVEHPGAARRVTIAGSPIKLGATPARVRGRAPLLGEHTDEILAELGPHPRPATAR